jgi:hypothetical protein
MSRKNWFTVRVKKANDSEDTTPYEPFDGHTLTISPDGTLWMADEKQRALSIAPGGYAGFELKRLDGVKPGDRLQIPMERKHLPVPQERKQLPDRAARLRRTSLTHK